MMDTFPAGKSLSYACGTSEVSLLGKCIGQVLDDTAEKYPDHDGLVVCHQELRYTYGELREEVERAARGFLGLGIQKGDRVGIWSTNSAEWVLIQFATAKIGAILVNINPSNRARELEYVLRQSDCQTLLLTQGFRDNDYIEAIRQICPELDSTGPGKLQCSSLPYLRNLIFLDREAPTKGMMTWDDLLRMGRDVAEVKLRERELELECDDAINIQYTSGTTGFPKGATLSHHNIVNNALVAANILRFTHRDRLCIPVPFYHCFGMVLGNLACVTHGATMVLPAPHFSPVHTLEAVARERCTALHGVPTMFIAELDHPQFREFDLSSLRTGIMAGAPCPVEVMKRVMTEMHCREITIACGMTETSPVCNMTEVDDPLKVRVSTIGKVMPHQEQKIVDPATGRILPRGEHGELYYRGYHVMRGYCNNPQATHDMIGADGWLHSGDMAVMDAQGYVQITGRLKDMICRGGEKIFPREVEEFLFTHPKIAEAYVIGVPDAYYGEQVAAWVKVKPGQALTADELQSFCQDR